MVVIWINVTENIQQKIYFLVCDIIDFLREYFLTICSF